MDTTSAFIIFLPSFHFVNFFYLLHFYYSTTAIVHDFSGFVSIFIHLLQSLQMNHKRLWISVSVNFTFLLFTA